MQLIKERFGIKSLSHVTLRRIYLKHHVIFRKPHYEYANKMKDENALLIKQQSFSYDI